MRKFLSAIALVMGMIMLTAGAVGATADGHSPEELCVPAVYENVLVRDGYTETITESHWQRYSWTGGPHRSDDPPDFPSEDWQPNVKGDPHKVGQEGAYFQSHGNSGNGDWFYLERVEETTTIEHPPVYEKRLAKDGYCIPRETVPPTTESPVTITPPTEPPVTTPPVDKPPVKTPPVDVPPATNPPVDTPPTVNVPDTPTVTETPAKREVPTAVKTAELARTGNGETVGLVVLGLVLLGIGFYLVRRGRI